MPLSTIFQLYRGGQFYHRVHLELTLKKFVKNIIIRENLVSRPGN